MLAFLCTVSGALAAREFLKLGVSVSLLYINMKHIFIL